MEDAKARGRRRLLRTRQAAEYLNVSLWAVRQLIADGKLPTVSISGGGRAFLIDLRDLDGIIEREKVFRA